MTAAISKLKKAGIGYTLFSKENYEVETIFDEMQKLFDEFKYKPVPIFQIASLKSKEQEDKIEKIIMKACGKTLLYTLSLKTVRALDSKVKKPSTDMFNRKTPKLNEQPLNLERKVSKKIKSSGWKEENFDRQVTTEILYLFNLQDLDE